jgi:hypothetical protein
MSSLVELLGKLDKGCESAADQERLSSQRDLVLWAINQPEDELHEQLADASYRVQRCEGQRTSCLVEMIGNPQERDPTSFCSTQTRLDFLELERQNCLLALQARLFFLEFGQTPEFEGFISVVV